MIAVLKSGIVELRSYPKVESYRFYIGKKNVPLGLFKREKQMCVMSVLHGSFTFQEFTESFGDKYYIENNTIYSSPHCTIHLANGTTHDKYFKTREHLQTFVDELLAENPHIII